MISSNSQLFNARHNILCAGHKASIDLKRLIISLLFSLICLLLWPETLTVALDGSQAYSSIQVAINASSHGDTVLVYPGRYYENIRFNGKNITLASLELITGNRDYVYSTIIDANYVGAGIIVLDLESDICIQGFTITNGIGYYNEMYDWYSGGGIAVGNMTGQRNARIVNCNVTGNRAENGAGVYLGVCNAVVSGLSIHDNNGSIGGGLYYAGSYNQYGISFDPVNRCSIYRNFAAVGSDIYTYHLSYVHVVVDTFTVANPWNFYASAVPSNPNIDNPYSFDILHTVHEEVNHDLYVATWGDDSNSGLSAAEPLRSIFMAMYRIASDSLNPKTVYVEDGHYSPSLNGQIFPVPVKNYVSLVGDSREGTILDGEGELALVSVPKYCTDITVEDFSLIRGKGGLLVAYSNDLDISNISVLELYDSYRVIGVFGSRMTGKTSIRDVDIRGIASQSAANGIAFDSKSGTLELRNIDISGFTSTDEGVKAVDVSTRSECDILIDGMKIHNNSSNTGNDFTLNSIVQIFPFESYATRLRIELRNSAIYDNYQARPGQMGNIRSLNDTLFIENCTFAGNSGGSPVLYVQGSSVLRNNIFHNPAMNTQLAIPNFNASGIYSHTTLSHNNILGGIGGVYNASSQNPLIWGDGNTDLDPLFSFEGNRPYSLSALSPLIDSGWQPASGLAIEALDAGGNERLWDGDGDGIPIIDKGAYEYQYLSVPINLSASLNQSTLELYWEMPTVNRALSGYRVFRNDSPHADLIGAENMHFREQLASSDTLVYRVAALYGNMESARSDSVVVAYTAVSTADENLNLGPIMSIHPNPFSTLTTLRVNCLSSNDHASERIETASIFIYNARGQRVKTIWLDPVRTGEQMRIWDGRDEDNIRCSSGIYIMSLEVNGKILSTKKVTLIR